MEHAGVKTLLDRIFKQNGGQLNKTASKPVNEVANDGLTIVFDDSKKLKIKNDDQNQSSNAFTNFKENLRQRMKSRKQEIRKEEEEDDKLDEEYHIYKKENNDDQPQQDEMETDDEEDDEDDDEFVKNPKINTISDESEDENTFEKSDKKISGDENSDDDFQLNLNDDDEESESELVLLNSHKKKIRNKSKEKRNAYDFDKDDAQINVNQQIAKIVSTTSLNGGDIPNTIPSNQPNNSDVFDFDSQEYLEGTQYLIDKQKRRSLDEITNISFNYETTQQQLTHNASSNTLNSYKSKASSTTNLTILNKSDEDQIDEFDELAMLCSGQFKESSDSCTTKSTSDLLSENTKAQGCNEKKLKPEINFTNGDLFAADESDSDEEIKKKSENLFLDLDENSNTNSDIQVKSKSASSSSLERSDDLNGYSKKSKHNRSHLDSESENESEKDLNEKENSNEKKIKNAFDKLEQIKKYNENDNEDTDKQGFFEDEAELSGSDVENDENYDGDSGDDDSIVFSGDESELPGAKDLQNQLGKIYLKDQMDEDKRQIRLFKEMYIGDKQSDKKDHRKKQFRWKNDVNWNDHNQFSSDEEDEEEEEEEDDANTFGKKDSEKKNEKYLKLMETRNWRMIRHEREEFVKKKNNTESLLSDDELDKIEIDRYNKKNHAFDDSDTTNKNYTEKSRTVQGSNFNSIFRLGEQLLKKKTSLNKTEQNKRALNGDINIVNRETILSTSSSYQIKDKNEKDESGKSINTENLLKKFSFLKKDKTYLSKLSSYVNKNLCVADNTKASNLKSRNNTGMVFTKVDLTIDEDENFCQKSMHTSSAIINQSSEILNEKRGIEEEPATSKIAITPTSKRIKYDTCDSIFNHIN